MRWGFSDDPTAFTAEISYFDRTYQEFDAAGNLTYAEFHRTLDDWIRALQTKGPFVIDDLIEPEWPADLHQTWGQWSPSAGGCFPAPRSSAAPSAKVHDMLWHRLLYALRRVLAWWIDAFLVASVLLVIQWLVNATLNNVLGGTAGDVYQIVGLAVLFYAYQVAAEGQKSTSLGKWSLRLEVVSVHPAYRAAALRNSWLLLTGLAVTGIPHLEAAILLLLGACVLTLGRHPFDWLAGAIVIERELTRPGESHPEEPHRGGRDRTRD